MQKVGFTSSFSTYSRFFDALFYKRSTFLCATAASANTDIGYSYSIREYFFLWIIISYDDEIAVLSAILNAYFD